MKARLFLATTALMLGLCLTGCQAGPSLVGKWQGDVDAQGQKVPATIELKSDKTSVMSMEVVGLKMEVTGTYEIKEDKVTMTVANAQLKGDLPPQAAAMKPMIEAELKKMQGSSSTSTFKFEGNDSVTLTSDRGSMTWTRVKAN